MTTTIRPPRADELPLLGPLEVAAGRIFIDVGMPEIAGDEGLGVERLEVYRADGRAWVTVFDDGPPVAYVIVDVVDETAHVEQISVHPDHAGQGLGRWLLDHVDQWAREQGYPSVTLCTFRDVPWNGPYYERCGFRFLEPDERGPGLVALMEHEVELGLDPALRVAMRKAL